MEVLNQLEVLNDQEVTQVSGGYPEPNFGGFMAYLFTGFINGVQFNNSGTGQLVIY